MSLPIPALLRRTARSRPQNSRSMRLKILPPRKTAPGPADAAGCALVSALLFLGCGGCFLRLFALPASGALTAATGLAAIAAFSFLLPLRQVTARMKYAAAGGVAAGSVLLWLLNGERARNGLVLVVNAVQQLFAAEFSRIEPRYVVTVPPEEYLVSVTLFLIPFALLFGLLCCLAVRYAVWQPFAVLLAGTAALGLLRAADTGGIWTLLFCAGMLLLASRALSAGGGAPDRGAILLPAAGLLAATLLLGGVFLLPSARAGTLGEPLRRGGQQLREWVHALRYEGEMLPGLPEGDLTVQGDRLSMKDALVLSFEGQPYPMHLRGYVGQRFDGVRWQPLDPAETADSSSLFYRLHQNGFYPQIQLSLLARALGASGAQETGRMTVENSSACTAAVYAPYSLAGVETDGLLAEDSTVETGLLSPGWHGASDYVFSVLPAELADQDRLVQLFEQQLASPSQALADYLDEEGRYRYFVYQHYTAIPDAEREILAPDLGEAGVAGETHRGYADAKTTIFSVLNAKLSFSTRAPGCSGEGSLIQALYNRQTANAAQYATAAVLMLRYCGIPARYVEGYLLTAVDLDGTGPGETVYIPSGNASAWAEYYHDGVGWLPFDVIPGYQQAVSEGIPPQSAGGGDPPPEEDDPPPDPPPEEKNPLITVLSWLLPLWILLLLAFLWVARRYWLISRRERSFAVEDPNQAVCNMTAFLLRLFAAVGLPEAGGSIRRLTGPAGEKWGPEWEERVGRMTGLFEKAAFSPHWLTDQEMEEAAALVDEVIDQVDGTESRKSRFILRWIKCLY